MKALVLHAVGDLRLEQRPTPMPQKGEVLVRVAACGVCGSDIPRIFAKGAYAFPLIPGHEFSGIVEVTGMGVDAAWKGKRVAVFPLLPCRRCPACEIGAYAQCEDYGYLGSRSDGAFAEYVTAPAGNLIEIPAAVSLEEAAMAEPAAVAAHALRRAAIDIGAHVLIFGAGPIGLMLGKWAERWGAEKVLIIDIDIAKLRFARQQGFLHLFDGKGDVAEWAKKKTGRGADVVIEASGSPAAFEQSLAAARPFGAVVLMGNPSGTMSLSQNAYGTILRKELRLLGSWNSSFAALPCNEWKLGLEFMAAQKLELKPLITHRTSLDGLWDSLLMMRDRTQFFNKVMMINQD